MSIGLVTQKCGMTRIFTDNGESIPVTVLNVAPNRVVQVKTSEKDGYRALQVTTGSRRTSLLNKPLIGHFAKANVSAGRGLWEFRLVDDEGADIAVGNEFGVDIFNVGSKVDVTSFSKGKGFAGVVKRYSFSTQDATHGNSLSHRAPGSIGQCQDPGRVFKGKKMAGHMGDVRCTIQNQEIVRIDKERNLLFIKGAVPGARGANVIVESAVKTKGENSGA
ncbi:MAG: 50S ribosomal protein L3 [Coxiella sp. DG_40]|nr:MAG: 50S ribosomal protein L3 [Coxiella sp. DG_40]